MNLLSWVILLSIVAYCSRVIYKKFVKKEGGCADCPAADSCPACKASSSCKFEEGKKKESPLSYK